MATFPIYQIYIELEDYEPKMWRRFQVMNDIKMSKLAYIIMVFYELRKNYTYEFRKNELELYLKKHPEYAKKPERLERLNKKFSNLRYGIIAKNNMFMYKKLDDYNPLEDATKVNMKDVLTYPNDEITFIYDPETNWKIKVVLEKIIVDKSLYSKELPKIIEGEGYGIVETCSSSKDLKKFRDRLKADGWKNKTAYKFYSTLNNSKDKLYFDKIDLDDMNFRIKTLPRALQEYYEQGINYDTYRVFKIKRRRYTVYTKSIDKS